MLVRNVKLNDKTFFVAGGAEAAEGQPDDGVQGAAGDARPHRVQRALGQDGASNGFGKCVSAAAKARNLSAMHAQIMTASKTCKAKGLKGAKLGQCVAATRPRRRDQDREGGEEGREEGPLVVESGTTT